MAGWASRVVVLFSFLVIGTAAFAHAGHEHVRGVVTAVSAQSITVRTADGTTRALTVTAKTVVQQGGKPAHLADLKPGERVVVDVPEKKTEAVLIRFGPSTAPPAAK